MDMLETGLSRGTSRQLFQVFQEKKPPNPLNQVTATLGFTCFSHGDAFHVFPVLILVKCSTKKDYIDT